MRGVVEQARASGIMRLPHPHDHNGHPCLLHIFGRYRIKRSNPENDRALRITVTIRPDGYGTDKMLDTPGLQPGRRPRDRAAAAQDGQTTPSAPRAPPRRAATRRG